jgi:hypothetical protein
VKKLSRIGISVKSELAGVRKTVFGPLLFSANVMGWSEKERRSQEGLSSV